MFPQPVLLVFTTKLPGRKRRGRYMQGARYKVRNNNANQLENSWTSNDALHLYGLSAALSNDTRPHGRRTKHGLEESGLMTRTLGMARRGFAWLSN